MKFLSIYTCLCAFSVLISSEDNNNRFHNDTIKEDIKVKYVSGFSKYLESDTFAKMLRRQINLVKHQYSETELHVYVSGYVRGVLEHRDGLDDRGLGKVENIQPYHDKLSVIEHKGWVEGLKAGARYASALWQDLLLRELNEP